ncbi:box C/D snoRNA protein 1 [Melia azedarach]|uniref:Box C/D snoRNA protein 1 n=1 Tax=Melia azedarach TaxID=155640 RepID=A0ACC1XLE7_MELAZ|nr:box C/D snoRNA protein 1 [Melia azedarach]
MDLPQESASTNQNPKAKNATTCEECKKKASKYKCPACSIRTCGLACVKAHKLRTACSGQRSVTQFVPLSQFNDDTLRSDYNLLEEMKRVAESAQRLRGKLCGYSHFKLPYCLRSLRSAAASRRTKLLLLPSGMLKREKNQTRYDQRKKFISWTIEWRFHSTDVVIVDHGVHEDKNLCSVIENHLTPGPWNNQLRAFCEQLENLKLFIRKYPKGPKSPFRELDIKAPIRQQLSNIVILEYPVIYVFLSSHSYDFEVVKDSHVPNRSLLKDPINNDHQSPKGVPFKEEEIEEDIASSGTRVFDLMKHVNSSVAPQMGNENKISEKELNNLDVPFLTKMVADNSSHSSQKTEEQGIFGDMEYDFDQGLIDAYSDIIAQINPDDFLDLDGIFAKEVSVEGRDGLPNFRGDNLATEELEEGEIAE